MLIIQFLKQNRVEWTHNRFLYTFSSLDWHFLDRMELFEIHSSNYTLLEDGEL